MTLIIGKLYEINVKKSYSFYAAKNKFFAFNKNLIILFDSGTIGLYLGSTNEQIFESEEPDHIFLISDKIIHFSYFFHEHVNFVLVSGQNVKNIII
jgi:hypothetical protein